MNTIRPMKRHINDVAMVVANQLLPKERRGDVLGDFYQDPPKNFISELAFAWSSFVVTETGRAYYPTIPVQDGTMSLLQRFKQFNQLYRTIWRMNILVLSGFWILMLASSTVFPSTHTADFLKGLIPPLVMGLFLWLHKEGFGLMHEQDTMLSITLSGYLRELKRRRDVLWGRDWSPSSIPVHAFSEVLLFVGLTFTPTYVAVMLISGEPVPGYADWVWVGLRFGAALAMFLIWIGLRKSNKLTAHVFQDEIDTLERAQVQSMSV